MHTLSHNILICLLQTIAVYAVTSANSTQSSFACYYNATLNTFLGDTFSVNWINNTAEADITKETLQQQYEQVKDLTLLSHVSQFGQLVRHITAHGMCN